MALMVFGKVNFFVGAVPVVAYGLDKNRSSCAATLIGGGLLGFGALAVFILLHLASFTLPYRARILGKGSPEPSTVAAIFFKGSIVRPGTAGYHLFKDAEEESALLCPSNIPRERDPDCCFSLAQGETSCRRQGS